MSRLATTKDEVPFFVPAPEGDIFGIVTLPTAPPLGVAVVLLQGGGGIPSPHRNRMWVRLARRSAGMGFHAVRLDYHGVGESSGQVEKILLHRPFVDDLHAVLRWTADAHGIEHFVLVGTCFGARTALAAAERIEGLQGMILAPAPVRDFAMGDQWSSYPWSWYLRRVVRLLRRSQRKGYLRLARRKAERTLQQFRSRDKEMTKHLISPLFIRHLQHVVSRRIPVLLVYGDQDQFYDDFRSDESGPLQTVLAEAGEHITLELLEGKVHGFTRIDIQDRVLNLVEGWLANTVAKAAGGYRAASVPLRTYQPGNSRD